MWRNIAFLALAASLALAACAKGKDGEDGSVYAYPTWSSDLISADFSQAGVTDSIIYYNHRYQLRPGQARIYWKSNLAPAIIWYADVSIENGTSGEKGKDATLPLIGKAEDGSDGQDRVYKVYFSYNTMTTTADYLTDVGTASSGGHQSVNGAISLDPATAVLSPGVLTEE